MRASRAASLAAETKPGTGTGEAARASSGRGSGNALGATGEGAPGSATAGAAARGTAASRRAGRAAWLASECCLVPAYHRCLDVAWRDYCHVGCGGRAVAWGACSLVGDKEAGRGCGAGAVRVSIFFWCAGRAAPPGRRERLNPSERSVWPWASVGVVEFFGDISTGSIGRTTGGNAYG